MKKRMIVAGVALSLLASACSSGHAPKLSIGLKRVGIDLTFKDPSKGHATPRDALTTALPIPSVGELQISTPSDKPVIYPTVNPCPKAPTGTVPSTPVESVVSKLPAEGRYSYRVEGRFDLQSALFPLKGPLPPLMQREIRNGKVTPGQVNAITGNNAGDTYDFEVYEPGLLPNSSVTRHYRIEPGASATGATKNYELVSQTTRVSGTEATFTPTPPVTLIQLGVNEGATWESAGIDTASGTSMVVQGKLDSRQPVDVCGKVVEAYKVVTTERVVNINGTNTYTSQTNDSTNAPGSDGPGKPNIYYVYPNLGGIFVAEEQHTTTQVNTSAGPVTIVIDSLSTLMSTTPQKLS